MWLAVKDQREGGEQGDFEQAALLGEQVAEASGL